MDADDEIVAEFLVESYESLERLGQELVLLERDPAGAELLASIFRTVHSLKGTSGFLGFARLERLAHAAESLLARLRDRGSALTPEAADALHAVHDAVITMLRAVERTGEEGDDDHSALVTTLIGLAASEAAAASPRASGGSAGKTESSAVPAPAEETPAAETPAAETAAAETPAGEQPAGATPAPPGPPVAAAMPPPRVKKVGEILLESGLVTPEDIVLAVAEQEMGDTRPLGVILAEHGVVDETVIEGALRAAKDATSEGGAARTAERPAVTPSTLAASTVRVDVKLLDELMTLVGELVLARNQIVEHSSGLRSPLASAAQRLDLITTELQSRIMSTRMQPIGSAWNRFPRLVREVSAACSKRVRLELEGADTELDRSLIEAIVDPLTHLVRNAVDHGIEPPLARTAQGKPAEGVLRLRAFHDDGQVNIEVSDDGAGIDADRIRAKAVERGLITAEAAARLRDPDVVNLICLPGFSTAEEITAISGRGVGMDVVKANVESINGLVDVSSVRGRGTTVRIKIPLTLAIMPALVIQCGGERYAIPQSAVVELVRLAPDADRPGVEHVHGVPVHRLRGRLLSLVHLREQLGLDAADPSEEACIVVLTAHDRHFGLVVDGVHTSEEIVVKPLARQLAGIPVYVGATILGDGKVALILDVVGVAQRSGVLADGRADNPDELTRRHGSTRSSVPVVVVEGRRSDRWALPLTDVVRLGSVGRAQIERAGDRLVVQYDGGIMPLVPLGELVGGPLDDSGDTQLPLVVCHVERRQLGLLVERIVDVVDLDAGALDPAGPGHEPAPVVAAGRVTAVLDVGTAVRRVRPELFCGLSPAGTSTQPPLDPPPAEEASWSLAGSGSRPGGGSR